MALINTGSEAWTLEFEACEKLSRDIMEQLHLRDNEIIGTQAYDLINGRVRVRLKQFTTEVEQLFNKLRSSNLVSTITHDEKERRLRQVEQLKSRCLQLESQFQRNKSSYGKNVVVDMPTSGWGMDDEDDAAEVRSGPSNAPVQDLRSNQSRLLKEQDEGLDELSRIIGRQKNIARAINNEVDGQDEILADISENMDNVNSRMIRETEMIRTIDRKDSTCGYWLTIIILLIIIMVVALV